MLIDQFTPAQIAQIKKELKMTESIQKQSVTELNDKLRKVFPQKNHFDNKNEEALWLERMSFRDIIYKLADFTLANVQFDSFRRGSRNISRDSRIPPDIQEEYVQFVDEILAVIEKHKKDYGERKIDNDWK